jgi:predicted acetyltransferase
MSSGDVTVRAITPAELDAFQRADAAGFGENAEEFARLQPRWNAAELERTRAAFDGDEVVATSRCYSLQMTVPGGVALDAAGVSAVAVLPTHRRRGILRQLLRALLDDAAARGESLAMLTASEASIYSRFGFGVTTRAADVELDLRSVEFARPRPEGRLRLVTPDELHKHAPTVFDRVRAGTPGAVSRPECWWTDVQYHPEIGTRFDVLYETAEGVVDGFVTYGVKPRWGAEPDHLVNVRDLVAASADATHALWRYLCEIDLVRRVQCHRVPLDSPLPWLLTSPRAAVTRHTDDFVWTRVLDVAAALSARTYDAPGRIVLEVRDPFRPGGAAEGTFTIEGGPDGAVASRGGAADLAVDVSMLSAAWLGGVRWSTLASAGWVEERTPGALARADAMFASTPLPFPYTWF